MVIDYTGSVEGIYAFIYCTKWRSGQVLPMPDWLTDSQMKDRATQLLIKYKSGALVTQLKKIISDMLPRVNRLLQMPVRYKTIQKLGVQRETNPKWLGPLIEFFSEAKMFLSQI